MYLNRDIGVDSEVVKLPFKWQGNEQRVFKVQGLSWEKQVGAITKSFTEVKLGQAYQSEQIMNRLAESIFF